MEIESWRLGRVSEVEVSSGSMVSVAEGISVLVWMCNRFVMYIVTRIKVTLRL